MALMRWRRACGWALCAAVCLDVAIAPAPTAAAQPWPSAQPATTPVPVAGWSVTNPAAPAWADQAPSNFPQAMSAVSCTSSTYCVSVGQTFTNTASGSVGEMVGTIESDSGGTWSALQVPFPPGWPTGTGSSGAQLALTGISCPAVGWCVASGVGGTPTGTNADVAVTLDAGTWSAAVLPTPAGYQATGAAWVSCPQVGACVVLADDLNTASGNGEAPVATTLSSGTWTALALPQPADAGATPGGGGIAIGSRWGISCATTANCTAVGMDTTKAGTTGAWVDTASAGAWTTSAVPAPAGAAQAGGEPVNLALDDVSCTAPGSCTAVGNYRTDVNAVQVAGVIETLAGGAWRATEAPAPPDADATQPGVQLTGIACGPADVCTATGTYFASTPASVTERPGLVLNLAGGTWTAGVLPWSASGTPFSSNPAFASLPTALACPSPVACVAAGSTSYGTAASGYSDAVDEATFWSFAAPPPTVSAVSPSGAPPVGGVTVAIAGSNFAVPGAVAAPAVSFGTASATDVTVVSDTEVTAVVPPGRGTVDVTVTTLAGTSSKSSSDLFSYATGYTPVSPTRICDTRPGNPSDLSGASAQCNSLAEQPSSGLIIDVAGLAGVPGNATMVTLDVAVADPYEPGWLTVYPAGASQPLASNLNFATGASRANLVATALGVGGKVALATSAGLFGAGGIDVVIDVEGYVTPTAGDSYVGFSPERICDTRPGNPSDLSGLADQCLGKGLTASRPLTIQATGFANVPTQGVTAVALSITVTQTARPGWVTAYPAGTTQPIASSLNIGAGETVTNGVIVPVSSSSAITIAGDLSAQVIVDVTGWIGANATGADLASMPAPSRICDTRLTQPANPCQGDRLSPGTPLTVVVSGPDGAPSGVQDVLVNVTATDTTMGGYLAIYPAGSTKPTTSELSWGAGQTSSTLVVCAIGAGGAIDVTSSTSLDGLVVDIEGWAG